MTEEEIGNEVARAVWAFLQGQKTVALVPWVTSPDSPSYDAIAVAELKGRIEGYAEIEQLMLKEARVHRDQKE